jgi:DNA repair protein RadA/Sms
MAKNKSLFECQSCGFQSAKWLGKCPSCNSWDGFVELTKQQQEVLKTLNTSSSNVTQAIPITKVEQDNIKRISSFDKELDLVLGGGIVPGSLTLVGGSPGVGKSTLLLKIASSLAKNGKKVLYVSGEESLGQIKIRANRLDANDEKLYLLSQIELENIFASLEKEDYEFLIIDSIQTIYSTKLTAAPGSVSQVREVTFELMRKAKENQIATFIIGHITKEGSIAGPRVLEHMVDTVLYFEGDATKNLRILRGFKNRFGSTSEIGIFQMTKTGLVSVKDLSLQKTNSKPSAGLTTTVVMEGTRPIILEVEALVTSSFLPNPKRSATGFELNRLNMLLALLEKKLEIPLNQYDVFVNISSGIKVNEPAADLALIAAILSSFKNKIIPKDTVFIGEVSLIGDIKEVSNIDQRLKEASSQNFTKAIIAKKPLDFNENIKCFEASEVSRIVEWI